MKTLRPNRPNQAGRAALLALALLLAVAATACYNTRTGRVDVGGSINFKLPAFPQTGSHAVEAFTDMHFQPSYRVQEGPRILPPEGSVPITGKELEYATVEEYQALAVPEGVASDAAAALANARRTYEVNCLVCHGSALRGEDDVSTPILSYLGDAGARPRNLIDRGEADAVNAYTATDGEVFAWITYGGQPGFASALRDRPSSSWMPQFGRLLTEQERWELVMYIRSHQSK